MAKHSDVAQDKKMIKSMVKPGALRMKAGGPTSMDRKKFGRNLSRAKNQGG